MAKAIRIHAPGSAEMLRWEDVETPSPKAGEVLLRQTAVGLNYVDVYFRSGLYPLREYPAILGLEGAGVIEKVGEGVSDLRPGDRVAYAGGPMGAYAEYRTIASTLCVKLPEDMDESTAAAIMVQGLTVYALLKLTYKLKAGDICLVHAAAGGVGTLLCQWAKHLGATVIGTVSTPEKSAIAKENGCDAVILYTEEDIVARVRELTNGKGAHVVYDSIGKDTFMASLDCLRKLGMMVSFGQASGPVPPFDIGLLRQKGSLSLVRPSLWDYFEDPEIYRSSAYELLDLIRQGVLRVHIGQTYALSDAAQAHRDLEARKTIGATVLLIKRNDSLQR